MNQDTFTVTIHGDGSVRVDDANHEAAYVSGQTASELRGRGGRQDAIEAAIGYVAARMVAASNGFSYRGA